MSYINTWIKEIDSSSGSWVNHIAPYPKLFFEVYQDQSRTVYVNVNSSEGSISADSWILTNAESVFPSWILKSPVIICTQESVCSVQFSYQGSTLFVSFGKLGEGGGGGVTSITRVTTSVTNASPLTPIPGGATYIIWTKTGKTISVSGVLSFENQTAAEFPVGYNTQGFTVPMPVEWEPLYMTGWSDTSTNTSVSVSMRNGDNLADELGIQSSFFVINRSTNTGPFEGYLFQLANMWLNGKAPKIAVGGKIAIFFTACWPAK